MSEILINKDLANGHVSLQGILDQTTVMQAWPTLTKDLAAIEQKVTLDLNKVKHTDSAGLAWLLLVQKQCAVQQLQIEYANVPAALARLAKISDVEALLSLQ